VILPNAEPMSLELNSTMESVNQVEAAAEKLACEAGLDEDECFHVTVAVREVSLQNTGEDLIFTIADQGKGLDPDTLPDPLAPENLLRGSGRGIFLIRSFMDEVHFRQLQPGTELTLVKHLPPVGNKS